MNSHYIPDLERLEGVDSRDEIDALAVPRLAKHRALLLNVDFRPARLYPLSSVPWTTLMKWVIKSEHRRKTDPSASPCCVVLEHYPDVWVNAAHDKVQLPAVVRYPYYVKRHGRIAFTKTNVFLRDDFRCQYTGVKLPKHKLTIDHVIPRAKGGTSTWDNVVACDPEVNFKKGNKSVRDAGLRLLKIPQRPTTEEINHMARENLKIDFSGINPIWEPYLSAYLENE